MPDWTLKAFNTIELIYGTEVTILNPNIPSEGQFVKVNMLNLGTGNIFYISDRNEEINLDNVAKISNPNPDCSVLPPGHQENGIELRKKLSVVSDQDGAVSVRIVS